MSDISDSPLSNNSRDSSYSPNRENGSSEQSESLESSNGSEKYSVPSILAGRERRNRAAHIATNPINPNRLPIQLLTREQPPHKVASLRNMKRLKRGTSCGNCPGCSRPDCGECTFCKDKPKFGGSGKKKQKCQLRICSNFQQNVNS